jgi:microcystin-dependent protein
MRGRIPVGEGSGPGLSTRRQGELFGTETTFLVPQNMPSHNHGYQASRDGAVSTVPTGKVVADTDPYEFYEDIDPNDVFGVLNNGVVESTGGNQAHTNLMPTLCINFIIALHGVFPSRS